MKKRKQISEHLWGFSCRELYRNLESQLSAKLWSYIWLEFQVMLNKNDLDNCITNQLTHQKKCDIID